MLRADDDLSELANSLSELLSAPVTIEDSDAAVVAYSGGQQEVDAARVETILGRRVPEHYRRALAAAGVFDTIASSDEVNYFDLAAAGMTPRAVVAVRADGVLVGSIWVAIRQEPTPEQQRILTSAAPVVGRAIALVHRRGETEHRRRQSTVQHLLDGGAVAAESAERLGLRGPMQVVSMQALEAGPDIEGSVNLHLSAVLAQVVSAQIDGVLHAVLATDPQVAEHVLADLQRRFLANGRPVAIGVGRSVATAADLGRSRDDADRLLRAARRRSIADVVATVSSHYADLVIDHALPFLQSHRSFGPLARLDRLDAEERPAMRRTLSAYLDHGGDVSAAATVLHVHPNTVRNRLRRARDTCGVDVEDHRTRLALMIELGAADLS